MGAGLAAALGFLPLKRAGGSGFAAALKHAQANAAETACCAVVVFQGRLKSAHQPAAVAALAKGVLLHFLADQGLVFGFVVVGLAAALQACGGRHAGAGGGTEAQALRRHLAAVGVAGPAALLQAADVL